MSTFLRFVTRNYLIILNRIIINGQHLTTLQAHIWKFRSSRLTSKSFFSRIIVNFQHLTTPQAHIWKFRSSRLTSKSFFSRIIVNFQHLTTPQAHIWKFRSSRLTSKSFFFSHNCKFSTFNYAASAYQEKHFQASLFASFLALELFQNKIAQTAFLNIIMFLIYAMQYKGTSDYFFI